MKLEYKLKGRRVSQRAFLDGIHGAIIQASLDKVKGRLRTLQLGKNGGLKITIERGSRGEIGIEITGSEELVDKAKKLLK